MSSEGRLIERRADLILLTIHVLAWASIVTPFVLTGDGEGILWLPIIAPILSFPTIALVYSFAHFARKEQ